jgi:hypothetical protein
MTMLEQLSKAMREALNAIRDGKAPSAAHSNTIDALLSRALIAPTFDHQFEIGAPYVLSPVGETVYFEHEVMDKQQASDFQPGQAVQYLRWGYGMPEWSYEWQDATVERVTKAFVFLKFDNPAHNWRTDAETPRCKPNCIRRKPVWSPSVGTPVIVTGGQSVGAVGVIAEVNPAPRGMLYKIDATPGDYKGVDEIAPIKAGQTVYMARNYFGRKQGEPVTILGNTRQGSVFTMEAPFSDVFYVQERGSTGYFTAKLGDELQLTPPTELDPDAFYAAQQREAWRNEDANADADEAQRFWEENGFEASPATVPPTERDFYAEMSGVVQEASLEAEHAAADAAAYAALDAEIKAENDTSFEPYIPEPRMVNDKLVAVTGICEVCGCQYDETYPVSSLQDFPERPWHWANLVARCPFCFKTCCLGCGKPLPVGKSYYCDDCNAKPTTPAALCVKYPLISTFLQGGENAMHQLWAWYAGAISVALTNYEQIDSTWMRAKRSAAIILKDRFEEEYFALVAHVGEGDPLLDVLFHLLPSNGVVTVQQWMYQFGEFEYYAQMESLRQTALEHAVYVDPIPPTITPEEYRVEGYGAKQRAGVCRVWWNGENKPRLVEHVTSDLWYAHLRGLQAPMVLLKDERFTVEQLPPVRVNDHVRRIDDEQEGTVVGVSGGDLWVAPKNGGEPRWKRIHVNIVSVDDDTAEYEEGPRAVPLQPEEIARNCVIIRRRLVGGMRVGRIASVKHLDRTLYRVTFEHRVPNGFVLARADFLYAVQNVQRATLDIDLSLPPFWRRTQSPSAQMFQKRLDTAGIALAALSDANSELLVYHPFEDVLARFLPRLRALDGVLEVHHDNDDPCTAHVRLAETVIA